MISMNVRGITVNPQTSIKRPWRLLEGGVKRWAARMKGLNFLILRVCKMNVESFNMEVRVRKQSIFNSLNKTCYYCI